MTGLPVLAVVFIMKVIAGIFTLCAAALVLIVLIQKGRGTGLSGALGGGLASGLLGSKTGDFLTWATVSLAGVFLLLAMTFLLGLMLGPILQHALHLRNGGQIVGLAAGGTGIILLTLASIATTTKRDFSFMGKFLMVGIILMIVASLANIFLQIPAMTLAMSAIGVLLFSGFILYDVSRIVNGGETNYVMATLSLYMSIYNLFTSLLQLLMGTMGSND